MNIGKLIKDVLLDHINIVKGVIKNQVTTKILKYIMAGIGGLLAAPHVGDALHGFGVTVDQNQLALGIAGLLEGLRNFIKHKFGIDWL